jgi:hypothetical protein
MESPFKFGMLQIYDLLFSTRYKISTDLPKTNPLAAPSSKAAPGGLRFGVVKHLVHYPG